MKRKKFLIYFIEVAFNKIHFLCNWKKKLVKLCEVYLCTDQVVKKTMKNITILKNERKRKNNPLIFLKLKSLLEIYNSFFTLLLNKDEIKELKLNITLTFFHLMWITYLQISNIFISICFFCSFFFFIFMIFSL